MITKELKWRMEFDNIDDFLEQREKLKKLLLTFCSKHEDLNYDMESEIKSPLYTLNIEVKSKTLTDGEIIGDFI
jgi:DNA polymerase III delta prime subunit